MNAQARQVRNSIPASAVGNFMQQLPREVINSSHLAPTDVCEHEQAREVMN